MVGDQVRMLREARSWTQGHLADASGVSLRTIQRLEKLHSCSSETLLALASALDVDVRQLTRCEMARAPASDRITWRWLTPHAAAWTGTILVLPAVVFVLVNHLKYTFGLAAPYNLLSDLGGRFGLAASFEFYSPAIIVGGATAAILINFAALIQPTVDRSGGGVVVTGVAVRAHPFGFGVIMAALASLAAVSAYLVGETMTHISRALGGL